MKYIVRSIKYFISFSLLFILIIGLLVLTGAAEGGIPSLFKEGYTSILKIAIFLAVISAVYPMVGYIRKKAETATDLASGVERIVPLMENYGYILENQEAGKITFRQKSTMARVSRMFEDRITMNDTEGGINIEGLRKDVVRIASGIEYRLKGRTE